MMMIGLAQNLAEILLPAVCGFEFGLVVAVITVVGGVQMILVYHVSSRVEARWSKLRKLAVNPM